MLVGGRDARSPGRQSIAHVAMFMPSVVAWVIADAVDVGREDRRDAGPRLGETLQEVLEELGAGPAGPDLPALEIGHRRGGLGREWPGRAGVQVDAGSDGGERLPDRCHLLGIGHERADHRRMIAAMASQSADPLSRRSRPLSGLARPELLASTEWLADQLGRPELRILDVRWRPDGSGRAAHAAGSHPRRGPSRLADGAHRPIGHGRRAAPRRTRAGRERPRPRGGQRRRDGRDLRRHRRAVRRPDLVEHPRLRAGVGSHPRRRLLRVGKRGPADRPRCHAPARGHFTPRAQPRMRLTTPDVRALLGRPAWP